MAAGQGCRSEWTGGLNDALPRTRTGSPLWIKARRKAGLEKVCLRRHCSSTRKVFYAPPPLRIGVAPRSASRPTQSFTSHDAVLKSRHLPMSRRSHDSLLSVRSSYHLSKANETEAPIPGDRRKLLAPAERRSSLAVGFPADAMKVAMRASTQPMKPAVEASLPAKNARICWPNRGL